LAKLRELAALVRSKNAGPFLLTFDFVFADEPAYRRVLESGALGPDLFHRLYGTPPDQVQVFPYPPGLAIKVTIPRPVPSGDLADTDVFGGQLFGPLAELEIA
jgi:hypothetical protein